MEPPTNHFEDARRRAAGPKPAQGVLDGRLHRPVAEVAHVAQSGREVAGADEDAVHPSTPAISSSPFRASRVSTWTSTQIFRRAAGVALDPPEAAGPRQPRDAADSLGG